MNKQPARTQISEERWRQFEEASRAISKAFQPWIKAYRELLKKLRSEGFRVRWTCMMAPIQLEGHLPSGERFYFRCRHSRCSLSIAPKGGDPIMKPIWHQEISRWGEHDAGSLEAEEAEAVLRELLAAYKQTG